MSANTSKAKNHNARPTKATTPRPSKGPKKSVNINNPVEFFANKYVKSDNKIIDVQPGYSNVFMHYNNVHVKKTPAFHSLLVTSFDKDTLSILNEEDDTTTVTFPQYKGGVKKVPTQVKHVEDGWKFHAFSGASIPVGISIRNGKFHFVRASGVPLKGKTNEVVTYTEGRAILNDFRTTRTAENLNFYALVPTLLQQALDASNRSADDFKKLWPAKGDVTHWFIFHDVEGRSHATFSGTGMIYLHSTSRVANVKNLTVEALKDFGRIVDAPNVNFEGTFNFGIQHKDFFLLSQEQAQKLISPAASDIKLVSEQENVGCLKFNHKTRKFEVDIRMIDDGHNEVNKHHKSVLGFSVFAHFVHEGANLYRIVGHAERLPGMTLTNSLRADLTGFVRNVLMYSLQMMGKTPLSIFPTVDVASARALKYAKYVHHVLKLQTDGKPLDNFSEWDCNFTISRTIQIVSRSLETTVIACDNNTSVSFIPLLNIVMKLVAVAQADPADVERFIQNQRAIFGKTTGSTGDPVADNLNNAADPFVTGFFDWTSDPDGECLPYTPPPADEVEDEDDDDCTVVSISTNDKKAEEMLMHINVFANALRRIQHFMKHNTSMLTRVVSVMYFLTVGSIRPLSNWITYSFIQNHLVWKLDGCTPLAPEAGSPIAIPISPILSCNDTSFSAKPLPFYANERELKLAGKNTIAADDPLLSSFKLYQAFTTHPATYKMGDLNKKAVITAIRHSSRPLPTSAWISYDEFRAKYSELYAVFSATKPNTPQQISARTDCRRFYASYVPYASYVEAVTPDSLPTHIKLSTTTRVTMTVTFEIHQENTLLVPVE